MVNLLSPAGPRDQANPVLSRLSQQVGSRPTLGPCKSTYSVLALSIWAPLGSPGGTGLDAGSQEKAAGDRGILEPVGRPRSTCLGPIGDSILSCDW